MDHKIIGTTMPVLEVALQPGESVVAEGGQVSWLSQSIDLHTATGKAGSSGVLGGLKRKLAGGTLFMTEYTAQGAPGMVAFATKVPGNIVPLQLDGTREYMVHKHGYLCGVPSVNLSIGFQQKLSAGFLGGEGFILQRVGGTGDAWIELDGEIVTYDLQPGEVLRVHPGHVGLFDASVAFEITMVKGIKNIFFGADALFLAKLTGPGRVLLQSMPLANLAHALSPYLATESSDNGGSKISIGGFSLGS
jgi:uncharacterized protein (TIGR00266 family)